MADDTKKQFVIDLDKEVTGVDRYSFSRFMRYLDNDYEPDVTQRGDPVFDPNDSYFMSELQTLPVKGVYTIPASILEGRPDNLSQQIYGKQSYWHLLLWYNNIVNYTDLVVGTQINYPSLQDIDSLFFRLRARQLEIKRGSN